MSKKRQGQDSELLYYYRYRLNRSSGDRFSDFFSSSMIDTSNIESLIDMEENESSENMDLMTLKLKPEALKLRPTPLLEANPLLEPALPLTASMKLTAKQEAKKKEELVRKLQFILAEFSLYLTNKGKKHLIKDCVLDCNAGRLVFLSEEARAEFQQFRPETKARSRARASGKPRPRSGA